MGFSPLLLLWGTLVGVDLVSVSQIMIARPIVAGTVAGLIVGDPIAGGVVGAILELFALDVLPVGAARYPDYGLGAVAAAATAAGSPGVLGTGIAVLVGLVVAALGEYGMQWVRRANGRDVNRSLRAAETDARALAALQLRGIGRDAVRAFALTAFGLVLAALVTRFPLMGLRDAVMLTVVALGAALGVATTGAMRLAGRGFDLRWFVLGLLAGAGWVALA